MQKAAQKTNGITRNHNASRRLRPVILAVLIMISILSIGAAVGIWRPFAEAEGSLPSDTRARIGFSDERGFFPEENSGAVTLRVYISAPQSTGTPFTLTETRADSGVLLFSFAQSYTLPAGADYIDVVFHQAGDAQSQSGVRLSEILLSCDTASAVAGDKYLYGESEPFDKKLLAVVYDLDGESELIIEGLPERCVEGETGSISSAVIRSGGAEDEAALYYRIRDYAPEGKELLFENYNSALVFGAGEREKTLALKFFDNDYLNIRDAYKLDIYRREGFSKVFVVSQRRYLEANELPSLDFAIEDDEPSSDKYVARAQYYQPGLTDPSFTMSESGEVAIHVVFNGLNGHPLRSFRLYYTVTGGTAVYGTDYTFENLYFPGDNRGYITVDESGISNDQFSADLIIKGLDNAIMDGTRTIDIMFFVSGSGSDKILLQPLDTVRVEITDNEYPPYGEEAGWHFDIGGTMEGNGVFDRDDSSLTLTSLTGNNFKIPVFCYYTGVMPITIPVSIGGGTAQNGADYYTNAVLSKLSNYLYVLDLTVNDFVFFGTKNFTLTILEEDMTDGLVLTGPAALNVVIVGDVAEGYNYIDYSDADMEKIFNIGVDGALSFVLKRYETTEKTTYINLVNWGIKDFTSEHLEAGMFPYAVNWADGERQKQITISFKPGWQAPAGATLQLQNHLGQEIFALEKPCQRTTADISLSLENSAARYYFSTEGGITYTQGGYNVLQFKYSYSSDSILLIKVNRDILNAYTESSVKYRLTFDAHGMQPYIVLMGDRAEVGKDINDIAGTLDFGATMTYAYIRVVVPQLAGQKGTKYINLELYDPSAGSYIPANTPWTTYDLAKICIDNDVYPQLDFDAGTTQDAEGVTEIRVLEYENKAADSFGISLYFTGEMQTARYYKTEVALYSEYDLSAAGIEVYIYGTKVNAEHLAATYGAWDHESAYHTYGYKYSLTVNFLNKDFPRIRITLKYTGVGEAGESLIDSDILVQAEAGLNENIDFAQFMTLNTLPESGDFSDYVTDMPQQGEIFESVPEGLTFNVSKDDAEKDCHLYIELSGTAVYGEHYIIKYGGKTFEAGSGFIVIPKGMESTAVSIVPVDDLVKNADTNAVIKLFVLQGGFEALVNTLSLSIRDDEYYGDFSVDTADNQIVVSRESFTASNFVLNYTIREITGVYATDYVLKNGSQILSATSGVISFTGEDEEFSYTLHALTERGGAAAFEFGIAGSGEGFNIVKGKVIYASGTISIDGEGYLREVSGDFDLTPYSNFASYIYDYRYYPYYTNDLKGVMLMYAQVGGYWTEHIKIDYDSQGVSKLFASETGAPNKHVVPSAINPYFIDLNGDGKRELVFVVDLDTCFGGEAELNRLAAYGLTPGVYSLDMETGVYKRILALDAEAVSMHRDIYFADLKSDGCPEIIVFSTPWNETINRNGGGNALYIVDNAGGSFTLETALGGADAPVAAWVSDYADGHYRPVVNIGYYTRTEAGRRVFGSVTELSYVRNAKFAYIAADKTEVDEGDSITLTVYNSTGRAGTMRVYFSSQNAASGRDYTPDNFTLIFAEGEFSKQVVIRTLFNGVPSGTLILDVRAESEDYYCDGEVRISIRDASIVQRDIAFTIHDGFTQSYTSSEFITGDTALFSVYPLTIDGVRAMENAGYDIRFSVLFGNTVWTDSDADGLISVSGLREIYTRDRSEKVYMRVEFLKKGTSMVFYTKTFEADYLPYNGTGSDIDNSDTLFTEIIYPGNTVNIYARQKISAYYRWTFGSFKLEYTSTIDNRTYTFYSDERGIVDAQIDFGDIRGNFTYSYKLTSLTIPDAPVYQSGNISLRAPGAKMSYAVSIIDSVRQSLLRGVLVEVVGLDVDYSFSGLTNAETGALILEDIVPLKNYRITVNGDYGISYFDTAEFPFIPSAEQPSLSLELPLRESELRLDFVTVVVIKKGSGSNAIPFMGGDTENLYRYLSGQSVTLSLYEQQRLQSFYYTIADKNFNNNFVSDWRDYVTFYRIEQNVLFEPTQPYKSFTKNPEDLTVIFYRENPNADFGSVKIKVSGTELTSANSRYNPVVVNKYLKVSGTNEWGYPLQVRGPHTMKFYSFNGQENCVVDMEIISDMFNSGKKPLQLASFGTGLGAFLLQPVQEIFSALETSETPGSLPFLNNMKFGLGFGAADFAFEFDEENMTFSLYMGASKTIYEKSHGMEYDRVERPSLQQLYDFRAASLSMGQGKGGLGVGLGGKMMFAYGEGGWTLVHGEIYFSVSASYNYTKYIILPVIYVPAFFSTTITLEISTTIMFDWVAAEEKTVVTGDLAISLTLEIECGIGIKGFLSASIYGQAGIQVIIQMESGGTKLTLWVEGGVRIQIIFWKYSYSFGRAEWSTQSSGYIERERVFEQARLSDFEAQTCYSGVAMLYGANGNLTTVFGLDQDGRAADVLVNNVYEKSAPRIAELPDGSKILAWINYDESRGKNNAEVINYIYFDGENWSAVSVADDTLTADVDLALSVVDGRFVIVCTEVKEELGDSTGLAERLKKSDIALLVFDPVAKTFVKTVLTDNMFNDRQALVDYRDGNGIIVIYRSENANITDDMTANDFLCGPDADNKLYYAVYNAHTGSFGELAVFGYSLKAVSTMDVKIVGGIAYIVLEIDNDDNFDTVSDRELVLIQYVFATGQSRLTRLTENGVQDVAPALAEFNGKVLLAFRSGDELKYWYDGNFFTVGALPDTYTGFALYSDGSHVVLLFAMPVGGISQIFASVMDGETMVFSLPKQVTFSDKPLRDPFMTFVQGGVKLYFCADTYILLSESGDEEFRFKVESDIMLTSFDFYSELSVEVLTPDYSAMVPGCEYTFIVRVYNTGTVNVSGAVLSARLGGVAFTSVISGVIPGNGWLDMEITVTLPAARGTLEFEIFKQGLDEDTGDNSAEVEILLTDIGIDKDYSIVRNEDGTVTVTVTVVNNSAVDAENISVKVTAYSNAENVFDTLTINLEAGETRIIVLTIQKAHVYFNTKNEFWLKVYVLTEGRDIYTVNSDDYSASDNVKSAKLSRVIFEDGTTLALLSGDIALETDGTAYAGYIYTGDGDIDVTSSDPSIVSVNGKTLSALKGGSVTITVSDGAVSKTFAVNVAENRYTLIFRDGDGTIIKTESLIAGAAVTAPAAPAKTGYTFGGWDRAVADTMSEEDVTYTAQWVLSAPSITTAKGYTGTYDKKSHTVAVTADHALGNVTYQWYKGGMSTENLLEGQTGATLSVKDVSDSGTYYCRITYTDGEQTVYTDSAAIEVSIKADKGCAGTVAIVLGIFDLAAAGLAVFFVTKKRRGNSTSKGK